MSEQLNVRKPFGSYQLDRSEMMTLISCSLYLDPPTPISFSVLVAKSLDALITIDVFTQANYQPVQIAARRPSSANKTIHVRVLMKFELRSSAANRLCT